MRTSPAYPLREYMLSAQAGDDLSLERLLCALRPVLIDYARVHLSPAPDVDDLADDFAQEAMIRMVTGIQRCRAGSDREVLGWALSTIRNLCREHHRTAHTRIPTVRISDTPPAGGDGCRDILAPNPGQQDSPGSKGCEAGKRALKRTVRELPAITREILRLRFGQDATWGEIATELHLTRDGAKRRFQRVQVRLHRDVLEEIGRMPKPSRQVALTFIDHQAG